MRISKYNASGNDFIIFHSFIKKNRCKLARNLCNRNSGVGADGLIVLVPSVHYDFEWEFYNSDGSIANMCGNGTRACAHYAFNNALAPANMKFLTQAGVIESLVTENIVETQLTKPKILQDSFYDEDILWYFCDTGVPHLVTFVDDLSKFDLSLAKKMRDKYNANINFAKITDVIKVRTYERGVEGETLACGTGMAACFYIALEEKLIDSQIIIYPKSQEKISLKKDNEKIFLKGKVQHVFDANLMEIDDL